MNDHSSLTQPSQLAVQISALKKSYGKKAVLRGINLEIPTGTTLALLGPNGAGKTTTVEILQGLRKCDSGSVQVLGEDPAVASRQWHAQIGVVPQTAQDFKELSVKEAITHVSRFFANPLGVAETIATVGLTDDAKTRISRLSGGRRRRLDAALAIVGRPKLLFLDEPTTGFDPQARREFWNLIESLQAAGTTTLLTTHYLDEAAHLADQVAILLGGQIVAQGTPEQLRRGNGQDIQVNWSENGVMHSEFTSTPTAYICALTQRLHPADGEIPALQVSSPSLEERYLKLLETKKN